MDKQEILTSARMAREAEVLEYQINIDNYRLAINKARPDTDLAEFVQQLEGLLASSLLEQKKAKVMLAVIVEQLEA